MSAWTYLRRNWLDYRRVRAWALLLLVLYAVAGFLIVPWLAERIVTDTARADYGRELRIADIRVNPFLFTLEIRDLRLADTDGEPLAGFERLFVDFTLASLVERAWTFDAVHLDEPVVREERFADGGTRIGRFIDDLAPDDGTAARDAGSEAGGVPALLVRDLRVSGGSLHFTDHVPGETVELELAPIAAQFDALDTRPDRQGRNSLRFGLTGGGTVEWTGQIGFDPLHSSGTVEVDGAVLDRFLPYLEAVTPVNDLALEVEGRLAYTASLAAGGPEVEVNRLDARVDGLSLSAFEPVVEVVRADVIELEDASYAFPANRLRIGSLELTGPHVRTWLGPDGRPGLLDLVPGEADDVGRSDAAAADAAAGSARGNSGGTPAGAGIDPFSFELAALRVEGLAVDLEDRGTRPPAAIGLRDTSIALDDLRLAPGAVVPVRIDGRLASGGRVGFDGALQFAPSLRAAGAVRVQELALGVAEPYLQQRVRLAIAGGVASTQGQLRVTREEPLAYNGSLAVEGLELVTREQRERVLGWQRLAMERIDIGLGAGRIETSRIAIDGPFARVAIDEERRTNLGQLIVEPTAGTPAPEGEAGDTGTPLALTVEGITMEGGELAFSDRSLPLPFATRIHALSGRVSALASQTSEPAEIRLEGQVADHGLARIDGVIDMLHPLEKTDVRMEFRNLAIPDYSPYAIPFAGRRIAEGRMDLDLAYRIDAGRLQGSNQVVLHDLRLGEKVAHPGATQLPLGLAIALLKNSEGVIDLDLDISGNVRDPAFDIVSVLRQSLTTLLKRIVSSPFNLLASIVGMDSDALRRIEFLPGRSDLTPPQRERVVQLARALTERPELGIELAGVFDPDVDHRALQRAQALQRLRQRVAVDGGEADRLEFSDAAAREPLRAMFAETHPDAELEEVRERFRREATAEGEVAGFDTVAYHAWLAEQVIAAQAVPRAALERLAEERAERVRALMTGEVDAGEGLEPVSGERIRLIAPQTAEAGEDERIALEPAVVAD